MNLVYYPDPALLTICKVADPPKNKAEIKQRRLMVCQMFNVMDTNNGAGLAAPQVGIDTRMFVWKKGFGHAQAIWNPVLSFLSGSMDSEEGCLSLPNITIVVRRATSSVLSGFGLNGRPLRFVGNSSTTRVWQHEIDHLDGITLVDYMSDEDKNNNREAMRTLLKNSVA